MTNVNREFRYDSTHHPGDDELIDYLGGRLAESAHESVQSHLVDCDRCLELFRDVRDFFESHRESEQMIPTNMTHEWKALWERIKDEEKMEERVAGSQRDGRRTHPGVRFALAAMLLVTLGIGVWAIIQRRQKQRLAQQLEVTQQQRAQLRAEQENLADQIKRLEQEKVDLQDRARLAAASPPAQPRETRKPELNVPIYDLYARDFSRRSGNADDLNVIKVPDTAKSILLLLNGDGVADSPSYEVEIVSDRGQVIWRGKGLKKGHLGNLSVTVDRTLLAKGTYKLKLHGQSGSEPAEYVIRVD